MANSTHTAYATEATLLASELNSLANNTTSGVSGSGSGSIYDNSSAKDLFMDLKLNWGVQGVARSAGAVVKVWFIYAIDGTNYDDAIIEIPPVATFSLDAATTARQLTIINVPIPQCLFKAYARNLTGQTGHASASTLKGRAHSILIN